MPNNELSLTNGSRELAKPKGGKREPVKWSIMPERSILDIIMATEVTVYLIYVMLYLTYFLILNLYLQTEKCIVKGTIYAIDTDYAWYYFGCVKCHFKKATDVTKRDLVPVKHLWRCDSCHQSITNVAPQYVF